MTDLLREQFGVNCSKITPINLGLSAAFNCKVETGGKAYFLKFYDREKAQFALWTKPIPDYMPVLAWLNENAGLRGKIVNPVQTLNGNYHFENADGVFLLFDFIDGEPLAANEMPPAQIREAAEILACLHGFKSEIPVPTDEIMEDFSVPFCDDLLHFLERREDVPADIQAAVKPYRETLRRKNDELVKLAKAAKAKNAGFVLCHTDAHYKNFMQSDRLVLVDWEGLKLAPAEADLFMFTQKKVLEHIYRTVSKIAHGLPA